MGWAVVALRENTDFQTIFRVRNLDAGENNWILEHSYERCLVLEQGA
jgi:hypothetical protein